MPNGPIRLRQNIHPLAVSSASPCVAPLVVGRLPVHVPRTLDARRFLGFYQGIHSGRRPLESSAEVENMNVKMNLKGMGLAVCVGILCSTQFCFAETQTTDDENGYGVVFVDDLMSGDTIEHWGDMHRGRSGYSRVLLIRPRVDLRTQLLQSIEDL
ncbi:MAG: hypothetical protein QM784_26020 [Polyangiaceae bacterium]